MKIALVYDRVNKIGGAERVLMALHEIWPEAPLYTAVYNKETAKWADDFNIKTSFLQKFPFAKTGHELYPWLTPIAFESFNFDEYDVVISITSADAKGIITKPKTEHICYCLTPTRYLWSGFDEYFNSGIKKFLSKPLVSYLKKWDKIAANRPDKYVAISQEVQKRIRKYYGKESEVIYPPVVTSVISSFAKDGINSTRPPDGVTKNHTACLPAGRDCFGPADSAGPRNDTSNMSGQFFLVVSRLVPYKKLDIVIKAFNVVEKSLIVIGDGSERKRLENISKKNIKFLGIVSDEELGNYYQNCQAVIFPTNDDFGIVPMEAQSYGKPVIAYHGGGALETIIEGKTGMFFYPQTEDGLLKALGIFQSENYKPEDCLENAKRFDKEIFKREFKKIVDRCF